MEVVDHRHCEVCGDIIDVGERWCSQECIDKHEEAQRIKKRSAILIVLMAVFLLGFPTLVELLR